VPWDGLADAVSSAQAVFHLAGAGIADKRWSEARKRELLTSRTETGRRIVEAIQGGPVRTVAHTRPVDVALNQSGLLQRLEVLGDGGLCEGQLLHDLAAQARLPLGEGLEDGDAGGVPEGFRPFCQLDAFRGEGLGGCCSHDVSCG